MAPIHSSRSGLTGFFTKTGMSAPKTCKASAISCTANGLADVRAPIHNKSIPPSNTAATCSRVATSVATYMPRLTFHTLQPRDTGRTDPFESAGLGAGFPQSGAENTESGSHQLSGRIERLLLGLGAAWPGDDCRPTVGRIRKKGIAVFHGPQK